jgi:ParB family transcriptional regulator, chromosome partitioning protein
LALLALPEPVQEQVEQGALAPATAYEIGKVEDPEVQKTLAEQVVKQRLNRAETIEAVHSASKRAPRNEKGSGLTRGKKVATTRTLKAAGYKITVENRKGIDDDLLIAALQEALKQLETRRSEAA